MERYIYLELGVAESQKYGRELLGYNLGLKRRFLTNAIGYRGLGQSTQCSTNSQNVPSIGGNNTTLRLRVFCPFLSLTLGTRFGTLISRGFSITTVTAA